MCNFSVTFSPDAETFEGVMSMTYGLANQKTQASHGQLMEQLKKCGRLLVTNLDEILDLERSPGKQTHLRRTHTLETHPFQ